MRIVDRTTFLAMPVGTVFMKYDGKFQMFDQYMDLSIKGPTISDDFVACFLSEPFFVNDVDSVGWLAGEDYGVDFSVGERDGMCEEDQLFAVYSKDDVQGLIGLLQRSLTRGYE